MKKIIPISILMFFIPISVFAIYNKAIDAEGKGTIAEPIVILEKMEEPKVLQFDKNTIQEIRFKVKNNYNCDSTLRINEVNMQYDILLQESNENFPIKYELYNSKNEELLKGNKRVNNISINKNSEYEEEYKLVIKWKSVEIPSNDLNVGIKINAYQIR